MNINNLKFVLFTFVIFINSCSFNKDEGPNSFLKIGIQDNVITALVATAKSENYFKNEGLNVEVIRFPSGKLALEAMFNNQVDIATVADMPITANSFKRNDFCILSSIATSSKGAWIIARKDKGITGPQDLKNKVIATQKNSAVHFFMDMFLVNHNISKNDVKIKFMKAKQLPKSLINGEIDAFSMRNPFINEAKQSLKDNSIEFFHNYAYLQFFLLVTFKQNIHAKSKSLNKFLKALLKAEQYSANKENLLQSNIKFFGPKRNHEVKNDLKRYNFSLKLEQALLTTLEDQAKWMIENKEKKDKDINFLDYICGKNLSKISPNKMKIISGDKL